MWPAQQVYCVMSFCSARLRRWYDTQGALWEGCGGAKGRGRSSGERRSEKSVGTALACACAQKCVQPAAAGLLHAPARPRGATTRGAGARAAPPSARAAPSHGIARAQNADTACGRARTHQTVEPSQTGGTRHRQHTSATRQAAPAKRTRRGSERAQARRRERRERSVRGVWAQRSRGAKKGGTHTRGPCMAPSRSLSPTVRCSPVACHARAATRQRGRTQRTRTRGWLRSGEAFGGRAVRARARAAPRLPPLRARHAVAARLCRQCGALADAPRRNDGAREGCGRLSDRPAQAGFACLGTCTRRSTSFVAQHAR
jgi:hypothetical protein